VTGLIVALWIFMAVVCASVARSRGGSFIVFLAIGTVIWPVGLMLALMIDKQPHCPSCAKDVPPRADSCPHCGTQLGWSVTGVPKAT
jgi:hypothetical protein